MKWLNLFSLTCLVMLLTAGTIVRGDETDDEGQVEDEDKEGKAKAAQSKDSGDEDAIKQPQPSPDAQITILFTQPQQSKDLPASAICKFLVNFLNKGEKEMVVDNLDVSFRYPMDYNFAIQNYTSSRLERVVAPMQETTFDYAFIPGENYAGRPFGLSVLVHYHDDEKVFRNAAFNETVNVVEDESPFNPETGFLYLLFACIAVLLLLVGQQFLKKISKKHMPKRSHAVPMEMGTANKHEVDFEWIPREVLNHSNKSPGSPGKAGKRKAKKDE